MDWKVLREEGDYALVEIAENSFSLIRYTPHRHEKHIGSIDVVRAYSDTEKVKEKLQGKRFQIIIAKPYDPDTDSDAERLGDPCGKEEALLRLWEHRHNIYFWG
jgi:hypothetical protein